MTAPLTMGQAGGRDLTLATQSGELLAELGDLSFERPETLFEPGVGNGRRRRSLLCRTGGGFGRVL